MVCLYDIVTNSMNRSRGIYHGRFNVRDDQAAYPHQLSLTLRNLTFNTHYRVRLYAFNDQDPTKEGPIYNLTIQTPPATDFNLTEDKNSKLLKLLDKINLSQTNPSNR